MTTTVTPASDQADSDVAAQLLAIAEERGYSPRVVGLTHDPGLVFLVPDDVAEEYVRQLDAAREETSPKRRRTAKAAAEDDEEKGHDGD